VAVRQSARGSVHLTSSAVVVCGSAAVCGSSAVVGSGAAVCDSVCGSVWQCAAMCGPLTRRSCGGWEGGPDLPGGQMGEWGRGSDPHEVKWTARGGVQTPQEDIWAAGGGVF
jgi:hypothetical protein